MSVKEKCEGVFEEVLDFKIARFDPWRRSDEYFDEGEAIVYTYFGIVSSMDDFNVRCLTSVDTFDVGVC